MLKKSGRTQKRLLRVSLQVAPQLVQATEPNGDNPGELHVRPIKSGPNGGISFGVEVLNLDLRKCSKETVTDLLLPLVRKNGLVLVRGTEEGMPGKRQVEISSWMSPIGGLYANHQGHAKQPSPHVFRLSNDESEGVLGGGDGVWHHDSMHMPKPPCFQVLHMPTSPAWGEGKTKTGNPEREGECAATWFAKADASLLGPKTRRKLARLRSFNLPTGQQHPLLNEETSTMIPPTVVGVLEIDEEAGTSRKLSKDELAHLMQGYRKLLLKGEPFSLDESEGPTSSEVRENGEGLTKLTRRLEVEALEAKSPSIYRHVYRPGDVLIQNNMAIAHRAPTSEEQDQVTGLRVLHRCLALSAGGGTGGA